MELAWFIALVSAICLEGLGRRYLPFIPAGAFYFLKDVVLLTGYLLFRPAPDVGRLVKNLYRGFGLFLAIAIGWTIAEIFNPEQVAVGLGLVGLRSYWLWWFAPPIVASALRRGQVRERAIVVLVALALGISALAAVQFSAPADANVNMYSVWNGEEVYSADMAIVASTGRARVASTFAFPSGFSDFAVLVPTLLLSFGLDSKSRRARGAALLGTFVTASVVPMTGSRSSVVQGVAVLFITIWASGLFFTRIGRRVLVGAAAAAFLATAAFPDAILGVQSRFEEDTSETTGRFLEFGSILPPVALAVNNYPAIGIGTGMEQNARVSFGIQSAWDVESENGRYLSELGPVGYLLVWFAKLGLVVALLRGYGILKRAGHRGSAAAALSFAALTMVGNLTFDHNWQALYFLGCGFILADILSLKQAAAVAAAGAEAAPRPLVASVA
jgi:hypothetical protein